MSSRKGSKVLAGIAGFAATLVLAAAWHALHLASGRVSPGYAYSQYLTGCVSWSALAAFVLLAAAIGAAFRSPGAAALGMLGPLPVAVVVELLKDRTSHNLLPFEVLVVWLPTFLVAYAGARAGRSWRNRPTARPKAAPPQST